MGCQFKELIRTELTESEFIKRRTHSQRDFFFAAEGSSLGVHEVSVAAVKVLLYCDAKAARTDWSFEALGPEGAGGTKDVDRELLGCANELDENGGAKELPGFGGPKEDEEDPPLGAPNPDLALKPRPAPPRLIFFALPWLKREFRNHEDFIASSRSAGGTTLLTPSKLRLLLETKWVKSISYVLLK